MAGMIVGIRQALWMLMAGSAAGFHRDVCRRLIGLSETTPVPVIPVGFAFEGPHARVFKQIRV